ASTPVAGTVTYNSATNTATLQPSVALDATTTYTAKVDTTVRAADGTFLASPVSWSFSTALCPCSLLSQSSSPTQTNLDVQDGRPGAGPFSYELGLKLQVDDPMTVTALRFWKSPLETGTH